jgi:hypothetical protein
LSIVVGAPDPADTGGVPPLIEVTVRRTDDVPL